MRAGNTRWPGRNYDRIRDSSRSSGALGLAAQKANIARDLGTGGRVHDAEGECLFKQAHGKGGFTSLDRQVGEIDTQVDASTARVEE